MEADSVERLPIIALTGYAGPEAMRLCLEQMDDFMTKPLIREALARMLLKHVKARTGAVSANEDQTDVGPVSLQASSFSLTQADSSFTSRGGECSFV